MRLPRSVIPRAISTYGSLLTRAAAGTSLDARSSPGTPLAASPGSPEAVSGVDRRRAATDDLSQLYTATLSLSPSRATTGTSINASGTGYPAGATVELVWHTVKGHYEIEGGTEFIGQRFEQSVRTVACVTANQDGSIQAVFDVPVGFGGTHDVRAEVSGREIAQAGLTVDPTITITPEEGPIGTPIELRVVGVDLHVNLNTWHILYDNRYLGFASAVTTGGVAVARFRAAGRVGKHYVSVWNNSYNSCPYLAWSTSPFRHIPGPGSVFTFRVTADQGPAEPVIESFSEFDNPWRENTRGPAKLSLSVDRGTVGQVTTLSGSGLPANTTVTLLWSTTVGDRVSGVGQTHLTRPLGDVATGPDGTFSTDLRIPDDLGGQHQIEVRAGEDLLGSVGLVIQPSIVSIGPLRVRQGEEISFHLKGVGWTTYDNTYAVTYDNAYIGYACGFSTNGDVRFNVTATGDPGTHIVDLYPTIFKGKEEMPRVYSLPMLTYADDHPARITPAIRASVEILE